MDDINVINITELVEDSTLFKSSGISYVKVTKNGIVQKIGIPIKSAGVAETIDTMNKKRPVPPIVNIVIKPGDPAFKELGLIKKQHVKTYDFTDSTYLEEKEKFESELGMKIVLMGLDFPIKNKNGEIIENDDKKMEVLKNMGMSGSQFSQIVEDITSLTRWEEVKQNDFLEN